ncbi:MAG: GGDEF domain-containing protein [Deltaproteobacteria bacterium]|nr:GGDEF domain-containing protein [Deltaproteobacteria bacterium]
MSKKQGIKREYSKNKCHKVLQPNVDNDIEYAALETMAPLKDGKRVSVSEATRMLRSEHIKPTISVISKEKETAKPIIHDEQRMKEFVASLDFAFQPIVNIHTGVCLGFEALLRGVEKIGFTTIQALFDDVYKHRILYHFDLLLREKALIKFKGLDFHRNCKVFYNIDNRLLEMPDYSQGNTLELMKKHGLHPSMLTFEISEKHQLLYGIETKRILNNYKTQFFRIAIDDFGSGFSGLQLLYHAEPDYIKIDRFFIENIGNDPKKRLFVSKVINLAHILGITVIAEGVESEGEFFVCRDMGCDFVQGYLVQKPTVTLSDLKNKYDGIPLFKKVDRRSLNSDHGLIQEQMEHLTPISIKSESMERIFDIFGKHTTNTFFPVVNGENEPLGIIKEKDLKEYTYSKYGRDLLLNRSIGKSLRDFVSRCPVAEIYKDIENILEIFSMDEESECIIITRNLKYVGILSAKSLLKILNEKNLAIARDQNPLTKLPGNSLINQFIAKSFSVVKEDCFFAYFDFDNFKPFNDVYGFRRGDRAILLFADILKSYSHTHNCFVGHIGGDDFFVGDHKKSNEARFYTDMASVIEKFRRDIQCLYEEKDWKNGYIVSNDRLGKRVEFPLLTVSAAIVHLSESRQRRSLEQVSTLIARLKKEAKRADNKIAMAIL